MVCGLDESWTAVKEVALGPMGYFQSLFMIDEKESRDRR
jgi:hypothetical protein